MVGVGTRVSVMLLGALVSLAGGCAARTSAAPVAAPVELRPPAPPPRMIPAPPDPVEPQNVAPALPAPVVPAKPTSRPAARPPAVTPSPAPSEPTPAPALRPGLSTGTSATTEASVRALLEAARRDLARITPGGLTTDARTQFEAASRFADQADAALKARNLVYAGLLADKAATLAAALLR